MRIKKVQLEEVINQYYHQLNENDLYIWDYISKHKKACESMGIDQLAEKCNVSRTTILRFTQKLSFKGYVEFKVHLKMDNESPKESLSDSVKICHNYQAVVNNMVQKDYTEIIKLIYQSKRIFVIGTGMVQRTVAKEFKRIFYCAQKIFFDIGGGAAELEGVAKNIKSDDLVIIISISGESKDILDFARELKVQHVTMVSITKRKKNTLAQLSDERLYIPTTILEQKNCKDGYESVTAYFMLVEVLFLRYLDYVEGKEEA